MATKKNANSEELSSTEDLGQSEMQSQADKETEQGFVGVAVDKTDNEAYTVQGAAQGMPTPETERTNEGDAKQ